MLPFFMFVEVGGGGGKTEKALFKLGNQHSDGAPREWGRGN